MFTDKYGQVVLSEVDLCEALLIDPEKHFKKVLTDSQITIPKILDINNSTVFSKHESLDLSIDEFDSIQQSNWHMPQAYKDMDIAKWILEQCQNDSELQRAGQELLLFQERDMFDLLKYLKYLVDTMREHNIVWGVGRGSSVSSFVLYLIGIHKINSLYYDLPIEEFLK